MLDLRAIDFIKDRKPLCIAGPCSAENENQVVETARALKNLGLGVFRAGTWKPRTDPNSFQGIGEKALEWLKRVKEETGMLTATEVATPRHVELCLKNNIDILWIGSRTTTNPFAMQEIAESLRGCDVPVMVKNPINPDIDLWIGAMQRLNNVGVKQLAAIHRGFSLYNKSFYRNDPQWHIAIELRRREPNLPILCDPSHIAGKNELIQSLSQHAMDLQFDGLMIESHIDPQRAMSDARQQVTPQELGEILSSICVREKEACTSFIDEKRMEIDFIDNNIIQLLKKRMDIAQLIGEYKVKNDIALLQSNRYNKMLENYIKTAEQLNVNPEFIHHIFELIHEESLRVQLGVES